MDRRNFFRSALNKGGKAAVKAADAHIKKQATRWIRPPFAIDELDFILSCTRCDACRDACPHQVIFKLPTKLGAKFAATPALDLLNKGCHLCIDWPCVTACEANALMMPDNSDSANIEETNKQETTLTPATNSATEVDKPAIPKLAKASINEQHCLPYNGPDCGACFSSCPIPGALIADMFKPVINPLLCNGCALCRESCIVEPKAINISSC